MHVHVPDSFWGSPFAYDGRKLTKLGAEIVAYLVKSDAMGRAPEIELSHLKPMARKVVPSLISRGMVEVYTDARGVEILSLAGLGETVRPCRQI